MIKGFALVLNIIKTTPLQLQTISSNSDKNIPSLKWNIVTIRITKAKLWIGSERERKVAYIHKQGIDKITSKKGDEIKKWVRYHKLLINTCS